MGLTSSEFYSVLIIGSFWLIIYTVAYLINRSFIQRWAIVTRCLSINHAVIVSFGVISLLGQCSPSQIVDISFCGEEAENRTARINIVMMTYLCVDLLFAFIEATRKTSIGIKHYLDLTNIAHHVVGAVSMYAFITNRVLRVNSLFYAMTEISTIPLHISWIIKQELDRPSSSDALATPTIITKERLKLALLIFGGLTWLSFFLFRIVGSYLMVGWLVYYWSYIKDYSLVIITFTIVGNGILFFLNNLWFYRLTRMIFLSRKKTIKME